MTRRNRAASSENMQSSGPAAVPGSSDIPEGELPYAGGDDKPASPKSDAAKAAVAKADAPKAAVAKADAPKEEVAKATAEPSAATKYYEVLNQRGKSIRAETGHRTMMHPGKVVDSANYNIKKLKAQGVLLQEVPQGGAEI